MTQFEALLLTLGIEAPAAALAARLRRLPAGRAAAAAVIGSLATHPLLWLAFPRLARSVGYWPAIAIGESAVVLLEAVVYALLVRRGVAAALGLSVAANAASYLIGLAIQLLSAPG